MDKGKRKALEAAGFQVGDARDFLELTEEENQIVELRVAISQHIRELRTKNHLTQQQLASRLQSSQSRVAKIEAADPSVSLDLMFRGFFMTGGKLADLAETPSHKKVRARGRSGSAARAITKKEPKKLAASGVE